MAEEPPDPSTVPRTPGGRLVRGLRGYLEELAVGHPDALWRIDAPLSARYEITALQQGLEAAGRYPVVVVEHPLLARGDPSSMAVVTNLQASRVLAAAVLGVADHRRAAGELAALMADPVDPLLVARAGAPGAERALVGAEVDLTDLPVLVQHELDPGPYLSAAHVTTVDPDSGIDNTAIQRAWVRGPRELGLYPFARSHNMTNIAKWWARGSDAPVALWIGHHPAVDVGANQKIGYPASHWGRAGALAREPVRLMATLEFGEDLVVPADCEIVIEGVVRKDQWRAEGPFGEYTGYLGAQRPSPVVEVRALSARAQPLYHDYGSGLADMLVPDNLMHESALFEALRPVAPSVQAVHVPVSGRRFHCYIQLVEPGPGEARAALEVALANRRIKHAIVVDEDVDVFDERSVLWALATRVQWTRDVVVRTAMDCSPADPSLPVGVELSDKAGIDATLPVPLRPGVPRPAPAVIRPGGGYEPADLLARLAGGSADRFISA